MINPFKAVAGWFAEFLRPRRYWTIGGDGRTTTAKQYVSEDTALNYSAVWAATRLLCGTASSLPLPVYRGLEGDEREKDREHPVHNLLNSAPNPEQSAMAFRAVMWQWVILWGNGYAEIVREGDSSGGEIVELWPIHPSRVEVCRDENDLLYYKIDQAGGQPVELEPWEVFHVPSVITFDGIFGHGVITHARETIGAGLAAEKFAAHTYVSGVPRAVVKTTGKWDKEARDNFRKEWDEIYGDPDGNRMALLQGGADLTPFPWSAEDQQFLESRGFGVTEIARWFSVPPHMIGDLSRSTFSNIEVQGTEFVRYSLLPWLRLWEQEAHKKLFTPAEQPTLYCEHNVNGLLRGDSAAQAQYVDTLVKGGLMMRNEGRKFLDLPTVPGGNVFLVQGAMVPLDDDGKPQSEFANPKPAAPATEPGDGEEEEEDEEDPQVRIHEKVADRVKRILSHDLSRILTKESKRIATLANDPKNFVGKVEEFYGVHYSFVVDAVYECIEALGECGINVDSEAFVATWINDGKSAVIEASGSVVAVSLPSAIEGVINSKTWTERPVRAIERVENATANL